MLYKNMTSPALKSYLTFIASIKKIDAELSRDTFRWCLAKDDRRDGDFKLLKLNHYQALIKNKGKIAPPEFFLTGANVDIMDGRHRIYALNDAGYTQVIVCCKEADLKRLIAKISV